MLHGPCGAFASTASRKPPVKSPGKSEGIEMSTGGEESALPSPAKLTTHRKGSNENDQLSSRASDDGSCAALSAGASRCKLGGRSMDHGDSRIAIARSPRRDDKHGAR